MTLLIQRYVTGDAAAGDAIVAALSPKLQKMAGYYSSIVPMEYEELLAEAYYGLAVGLSKVDPTIGTPVVFLIKHARWAIVNAIRLRKRKALPMCPIGARVRDRSDDESSERTVRYSAIESALSSNDTYDLAPTSKDLLERMSMTSRQRHILDTVLAAGSVRAAAKLLGISAQSIYWTIKRVGRQPGNRKLAEEMQWRKTA